MSARVGGGVLTDCNSTDGHMHDQSGNLREFRIGQNITTVGDSPHSFPTPTNPKFCSSVGSSPPVTPIVECPTRASLHPSRLRVGGTVDAASGRAHAKRIQSV